MKVVSLFSGAGGLDKGFEKEKFKIIWANENDKHIVETFRKNFPSTQLVTKSITDIKLSEIPVTMAQAFAKQIALDLKNID